MKAADRNIDSQNKSVAITLIFTTHRELGLCTSNALCKIIEQVKPEVIFEELSNATYHLAHIDKTLNNLESKAIKQYVETYPVKHIAVDTFDRPEQYEAKQRRLYDRLTDPGKMKSFHLRNMIDQHRTIISQLGFPFLNGEDNAKWHKAMADQKAKVLEALNDDNLFSIAKLDSEVIMKREDVILENVNSYAKENKFTRGLMFIGSGHMKSIRQKIEERQRSENNPVHWLFFSDLGTQEA